MTDTTSNTGTEKRSAKRKDPAPRVRPTDNTKIEAAGTKRRNKLDAIRHGLESGHITSFEQIFAIISETRISIELNISFYAFRNKVNHPGEFTFHEAMRLSALFGVKYDAINAFIWNLIKVKSKSRIFRN
ncbi:MAG TPA: hypothetical protein VHD83_26325 [Puia sp.]|nr:hypothetical protein [Puia sp.]